MITIIRPPTSRDLFSFADVWAYREVLILLVWRDLKVRYKQTAIGIAWAILQPLAMLIVLSFFFGKLARLPADGLPYPVFVLAALIPWNLFARILGSTSESLLRDQRLISKVYFPRMLLPLATALVALVDFIISIALLVTIMAVYGVHFRLSLVFVVPLALWTVTFGAAVGLLTSALNVQYRDVQHLLPFVTQVWFFMTPVVYASSLVPERFEWLYYANPMVFIVDGFRASIVGTSGAGPLQAIVAIIGTVAFLVIGTITFRMREPHFADFVG